MHVEQQFMLGQSVGQTAHIKACRQQRYVAHRIVCEFCFFAGFKKICDLGWSEWKANRSQCIYTTLRHCSVPAARFGVCSVLVQNRQCCSFICCILKPHSLARPWSGLSLWDALIGLLWVHVSWCEWGAVPVHLQPVDSCICWCCRIENKGCTRSSASLCLA